MTNLISIIGGSGFVGSSLVTRLHKQQANFQVGDIRLPGKFTEKTDILMSVRSVT